MIEFDPGPTKTLARHLDEMPSYAEKRELFWYDWGPIFYRGRLNGSARVLGIASDPGPTERIAGRTLVGDAGQRVQGFLAKLGLTRSYVLVNAYAYALHPSRARDARPLLRGRRSPALAQQALRHGQRLGPAGDRGLRRRGPGGARPVGRPARRAGVRAAPSEQPQPGHAGEQVARGDRRPARRSSPPTPTAIRCRRTTARKFRESDYARIPLRDLPFGVPEWFGDDSWGRTASRRHNNSVSRPGSDLEHTLVWQAPPGQPLVKSRPVLADHGGMRHLSYANVMASVAVFVALGGGAYAAVQVNGKDIKNRTIAGKKVKNNTLGGKQINESGSGEVPSAARAQSAAKADSADATTAASATTAGTRPRRPRRAASATNAANASQRGQRRTRSSAALRPRPSSSTARRPPRSTAACAGTTPRARSAGWIFASDTCGNAGGRLPTLSELVAYTDQAGHPAHRISHWSSEVVDVGRPRQPIVAVAETNRTSSSSPVARFAYRCVFYRTN